MHSAICSTGGFGFTSWRFVGFVNPGFFKSEIFNHRRLPKSLILAPIPGKPPTKSGPPICPILLSAFFRKGLNGSALPGPSMSCIARRSNRLAIPISSLTTFQTRRPRGIFDLHPRSYEPEVRPRTPRSVLPSPSLENILRPAQSNAGSRFRVHWIWFDRGR